MSKLSSGYPLLTVEKLKYWYWECDPGYSLLDIVKVTGASYSRVQRFMEKNGIPRRDRSEANKNRFKCEHKKSAFLETLQSAEHREKQSVISKRTWSDPRLRKEAVIKAQKKLSERQIIILYLSRRHNGVFQASLVPILERDNRVVSSSLRILFERGLLEREKQENFKSRSCRLLQFKYFITQNGTLLLNSHLNNLEPGFKEKLNVLDKLFADLKKRNFNRNIGKTQELIIKLFKKRGSMFLSDFHGLADLSESAIRNGLSRLILKGYLTQKAEYNPDRASYKSCHYRYALSESGKELTITPD